MLFGEYDGKYKALTEFLAARGGKSVTMTFAEIEEILGFSLPASARAHAAWWANQLRGQSLAWVVVSYKTADVLLEEERVTFLRLDHPDVVADVEPASSDGSALSLADAKVRLAQTYGVEPSQIEIIIRA